MYWGICSVDGECDAVCDSAGAGSRTQRLGSAYPSEGFAAPGLAFAVIHFG